MKLLIGKASLTFRLGAMVAALLLGQQAIAEGTRAGTDIDNTVNVAYQVGGLDQAPLTDTVTFVVDRRVAYTLQPVSTPDLLLVSPGQDDVFVDFLLTNLSNSDLDFTLSLVNMSGGDVDGSGADTADMTDIEYSVVTATDTVPAQDGAQYVDDLLVDDSVRIRVWGDAALALTDGQIAGLQLTATAVELTGSEGSPGAVLDYTAGNDDLVIDNVDPAGTLGVRISNDGFEVQSADLTVAKDYTVIDDGFGGTVNPLPGATIQYTILITNNSTTVAAETVIITDTLAANLDFLPDWSGTDDMTISVDGGLATGCTEEVDAPTNDGCARVGQDLTFDGFTIAAGGSLLVTYRVTISDPTSTP